MVQAISKYTAGISKRPIFHARTVLGRKIDAGSTIIDLGVSAGRYRYRVVEAIWESDPTIDDWVYGNSASVPVCNVIDGATVELRIQGRERSGHGVYRIRPVEIVSRERGRIHVARNGDPGHGHVPRGNAILHNAPSDNHDGRDGERPRI